MATFLDRIKAERNRNSRLYTRMDGDEDLLYLARYVMRDTKGVVIDNIINVTLNRPAVFAANIISALGTTSEQSVVKSENKQLDTTYIEDFKRAGFGAANDKLRRQGRPQLGQFFDTQLSIRGSSGAKCIFQVIDGELDADITPWDMRWVTYARGRKGLDWASNTTWKTKDEIEAEPWAKEAEDLTAALKGKDSTTGLFEVEEALDTKHIEIWVDSNPVFTQPHDFGFTPVVIQVVSLGYGAILLGKDSRGKEGESIFFLIRDVIPELNRLASIMQTLNLTSVLPPVQEATKEGRDATARKHKDVVGIGTSKTVDIGGGISTIDFGDAQRSATLALSMFDTAIGEGSLSSADLGTIGSPPASGIRAIIAGENRDQVVHPRLEAKGLMNESLSEMFTKQVIQIGGSIELGVPGHKRIFQIGKLEGEYSTTYKYTAKSPITDAGLFSLNAAAGNDLSKKYKRENILQLQDPDGEAMQLRWEEAERLSPRVKMRRTIKDLIEMGEDEDAKLMLDDLGVSLEQLLAGESTQPRPEKEDQPTQVLSLFGGGQGGGGRPPPQEEE